MVVLALQNKLMITAYAYLHDAAMWEQAKRRYLLTGKTI